MKEVTVSKVPGLQYQQVISSGQHKVTCDIEVSAGGAGGGLDPKEYVLGGLGSCMAMTVLMVAARKKWDIQHISVKLKQTDEPDPANAGKKRLVIEEELEVTGNLTQKELDEIKATAAKCPVYKLMTEPKRMQTTVKHIAPSASPAQSGGANSPNSP